MNKVVIVVEGRLTSDGTYRLEVSGPKVLDLKDFKELMVSSWDRMAGKITTNLIKVLGGLGFETQLVSGYSKLDAEFVYSLSVREILDHSRVDCYSVSGGTLYKSIFAGRFSDLSKTTDPVAKLLESLTEKADGTRLVRFKYNGGNNKGVRIIRLEGVKGKDKNAVIQGTDLSVVPSDKDKGYRSFRIDRIEGAVDVLN
jgi:hypothetical protein